MKEKAKCIDEYPNLVADWDYELNKGIFPSDFTFGSEKKVWWKCANGHSYPMSIANRVKGSGCSYCSGRVTKSGINDLKTKRPDLIKEWDYESNDILPENLYWKSTKKVQWRCKYGHIWKVSPQARINSNSSCPYCAGRLLTGFNDLQTKFPLIAQEWSYSKNAPLLPSEVGAGTSKKVWWKCVQCGNEWKATVKNRTSNNSGCPRCSKHQRTSFPEQAILFYISKIYPDVENSYTELKENSTMELDIFVPELNLGIEYDGAAWHTNDRSYKKDHEKYILCENKGITLIRVSEFKREGSLDCDEIVIRENFTDEGLDDAIKRLFIGLGIEVDTGINVGRDRPIIAQQYITYIANKSIAIKYPNEAKYWDVEKNKGLSADMVNATSNVSYWWKCDLNHSYKATPANRLGTGNGCPYCSGHKVLRGFNDFATKYPDLIEEWDYECNQGLRPCDLTSGSTKKVFWKCKKGHSYKASPNNKVYNHTKCPFCANLKLLVGFNDLKTKHPKVLEKWDYEKNKTSPEKIIFNSRANAIWRCQKGHTWTRTIAAEIKYDGCPTCNDQQLLVGYNDLRSAFPKMVEEWNYEKNKSRPEDYTRLSIEKVWWKCKECGNEWQARISIRISSGTGCPKCGYSKKIHETRKKNIQVSKKTLADLFPELAGEWDYSKNELCPTDISAGANKKVWWVCSKGHSYQAWVTDRTGKYKTGCPYCSGKRALKGFNDLKTLFPDIASEWDYEKNDGHYPEDYSAYNRKKVWWLCPKGHSYEAAIGGRTSKRHQNGCPFCANKKVLVGYNDLSTMFPDIANEWNYELNKGIIPEDFVYGSEKKVWWTCSKCGFNWQTGIVNRTWSGNGCPECNKNRLRTPIRCIETNENYDSIKEASEKTGIGKDSISKNLSGKSHSAGGLHWEYI